MKDLLFAALLSSKHKAFLAHIYQLPGYVEHNRKGKVVPLCGRFNLSVLESLLTDVITGVPLSDSSLVHSSVCKNCLRVRERFVRKMEAQDER